MNATARALFECAIAGASVKPIAEFAGIVTDAAQALVAQHPKPTGGRSCGKSPPRITGCKPC